MATTTANPPVTAPPRTPKLIKRTLLIVLIALVAAALAGGGTWFYMSRHESAPAQAAQHPKTTPSPVPVFFALDPMTVNLQADDGDQHYLRIGLTLKLNDQETQDHLTAHMPEIRSRVLLALSNKHPEELAPLDGKRALAKELAALIEQPTETGGSPIHVEDVLFTEFVVQ